MWGWQVSLRQAVSDDDCRGHLEATELVACSMGQADLCFLSTANVAVARACYRCGKNGNKLQRPCLGPTKPVKLGTVCWFTLTHATSLGDTT